MNLDKKIKRLEKQIKSLEIEKSHWQSIVDADTEHTSLAHWTLYDVSTELTNAYMRLRETRLEKYYQEKEQRS